MTGLSKSISYFDRIFNEASCDKYYLSIRIQPDGLFYSVYDPADNKYIAFEANILAGAAEIFSYIAGHPFLTRRFLKKLCLFSANKYTLVPSPLFIPGRESEYLDFAHKRSNNEEVGVADITSADAKLIYNTDTAWQQIITDHFYEAKRYPLTAAFIDLVITKCRRLHASGMFINIYDQSFDLLLIEDGKLKYCNNFSYKSNEDLVYYSVFVIDQLNINAEKIELNLSGLINENSAMLKLLRKYIRNVELLNFDGDVRLSYALNDIHIYNYPDLFNSGLCEL